MFTRPMRRVDTKRFGNPTHHYVDAVGNPIPGVTTILNGGLPKPALTSWGIRTVAEYAVNRWDDLAQLPVADRLKELKGSPYAERDAAASRGTEIHALAERLINGEEVEVPDEIAGHVESLVKWLDLFRPEPVLTEFTCVNYTVGYAGTGDMVVRLNGETWLIDTKTSKGVYGDTALQTAAYARAEFYLDGDGQEQPMPHIDRTGVLHVRSDGADLYPLRYDDDVFLAFRYVARNARVVEDVRGWIGEALTVAEPTLLEA